MTYECATEFADVDVTHVKNGARPNVLIDGGAGPFKETGDVDPIGDNCSSPKRIQVPMRGGSFDAVAGPLNHLFDFRDKSSERLASSAISSVIAMEESANGRKQRRTRARIGRR